MARFTDIERAAELTAAKAALETWRAKTREQKRTDYRSKLNGGIVVTQRVAGYIKPFGIPATNQVALACRILGDGTPSLSGGEAGGPTKETAADMVTVLIAAIGARARKTMGATSNDGWVAPPGKKFKFAKVAIRNIEATGTAQTSRFTNLSYTSHPSQTISAPFGQTPAALETYDAAASAIKDNTGLATWLAGGTNAKRSLKLTPQLTSLT